MEADEPGVDGGKKQKRNEGEGSKHRLATAHKTPTGTKEKRTRD